MRIPMVAGNWKMNTTVDEAVKLVTQMRDKLDKIKGVDKVVCPPFISLAKVKEVIEDSSIMLGAQNVFYKEKGAYTGEISPTMLAGLSQHVIIGHSERRQYFGETDEIVNEKLKAAVENLLKPIMCIGETLEERESGRKEEVIAYEPIWAIGTGKSATSEEANKTIGFIRQLVRHKHGGEIADNVRILYGGSVTPDNISDLIKQPEIDGALVGGASLKAEDFLSIVRKAAEIAGQA